MVKKIFIAAGHGGTDSGAIGVNGVYEKTLTLSISKYLAAALKRCGIEYEMSRTTDTDPVNTVAKCNKYKPDVAVSVHLNAFNKTAQGTEVFYSLFSDNGKKLATSVLNNIVSLGVKSRGIKTKKNSNGRDWFEFIRETEAPAILVECCFIDNANDYEFVNTAAKQKIMAEAIAKGICEYLNVKYITEAPKPTTTTETTNTDKLYRVQVGAFKDVNNAKALQQKLKAAGYEAIIV